MKELKDITCCCVDSGIFHEAASKIGESVKKMYYCVPSWASAYPSMNIGMIGYGMANLEIVDSPFGPHFDDIDLFLFFDVHFGPLQIHLLSLGKTVWGSRLGEEMELQRVGMKQLMAEKGLPVGGYKVVKGMDALREYLKTHTNQFVKIDKFRATMETFKSKNYKSVEPKLDEIEYKIGAFKHIMEFVCEDELPDAVEIGIDDWTVDGKYPASLLSGIEVKGCYDSETEILTDQGWKYFKNLDKSERVLTLNISDNRHPKLEYQNPDHYTNEGYAGKMLKIDTQGVDLMVTPDHKLLIQKNSQDVKTGVKVTMTDYKGVTRTFYRGKRNRILERACDMDLSKWFSMPHPTAAKYSGVGKPNEKHSIKFGDARISIRNLAAFLGMYLSEGSVSRQMRKRTGRFYYQVIITQFKYVDAFEKRLQEIGIDFKRDKHGFRITNQPLGEYLWQFGKSKDKHVPDIIKQAGYATIKEFLHWYCMGDGSFNKEQQPRARRKRTARGSRLYYTISPRMADDLQEMMIKIGYPSNITERKYRGIFTISERTAQLKNWVLPHQHKWIDYNGRIYCVTVPNHIICVRRNGKPIWCGNSGYVGVFKPYKELPKSLTHFSDVIAPVLKEYGYRGPVSTEVRIGKDGVGYMIDFCARMPSPPNELQQEFYLNFADIAWKGANGIMVEPIPPSDDDGNPFIYGAEAIMYSTWAQNNWQPIEFPAELKPFIKLRNAMKVNGRYYIIPQHDAGSAIGAVIGWGHTLDVAEKKVKAVAEQIEGFFVEIDTESFDKADEELAKCKEYGIKMF